MVDVTGNKCAVIYTGETPGHIALLVQHNDGKYHYYSYNGDKLNRFFSGSLGLPFNHLGDKGPAFDSVAQFKDSTFNTEGNSETQKKFETSGFVYTDIIELDTTPTQDSKIISSFKESAKFPYDLSTHNCANVVSDAIMPIFDSSYESSFSKNQNKNHPSNAELILSQDDTIMIFSMSRHMSNVLMTPEFVFNMINNIINKK